MPSLTISELLASPESLLVDGVKLSANVYLNRDFFPQSPPQGRPLAAFVFLNGSPAGTLPPSVSDVYVWAIRDSSEVWRAAAPFEFIDWSRNGAYEFIASDGPLWDPGILVDVVVGVRTSPTSVSLVLFPRVLIHQSS